MASTLTRTAAALAVASLPLIAGATTAQAGDGPTDGRRSNHCWDKKDSDKARSIASRDQCERPDRPPITLPTTDPTRDGRHTHGDYDRSKYDDKRHEHGGYGDHKRDEHKRHHHHHKQYDPPKHHHYKKHHHKRHHDRVKYDPYNEVRTATAKYFSVKAAEADGYRRPASGILRGCITQTPGKASPAMGFHWVNAALEDTKVELTKPEVLVYEPTSDGKLDLVAVEYVVPKAAWDKAGNLHPPKLFGLEYSAVSLPGIAPFYALHAWVWKFNPDGIHADFNVLASCRYASLQPK